MIELAQSTYHTQCRKEPLFTYMQEADRLINTEGKLLVVAPSNHTPKYGILYQQ